CAKEANMRGYRCRAPWVAASGHWVVRSAALAVRAIILASACRPSVYTGGQLTLVPPPTGPPGTIASISIDPTTSTPMLGDVVLFTITGTGVCGYMHVYFGDGSMFDYWNRSLDNGLSINHAY